MDYYKLNKVLFNKASVFAVSFSAILLLSIWSFFEASFWFVASDFLIAIFCFLAPKKFRKFIFVSILFSLLGGILYYFLNIFYFEQISLILHNTPFVSEKNFVFVSELLSKYGVLGAFFQSFTLIPFKIWTNISVNLGFNFFVYFLIVTISRIIRFSIFGYAAILFRKYLEKFFRNNFLPFIVTYIILFFTVMFVLEA